MENGVVVFVFFSVYTFFWIFFFFFSAHKP